MNTENNPAASSDAEKPKRKRIAKTDSATAQVAEKNESPVAAAPTPEETVAPKPAQIKREPILRNKKRQ